ncbi:hypothetical protein [Gottfriedia solisilvae]|uniref:hypothetical protein n=1 Tax=Gottfriedia solisilvae TaxID=1516104 RepID=UPI003D2EEB79
MPTQPIALIIAHGGTMDANESNLINELVLLKRLITALLLNEELNKICNVQQLNDWIKNKKILKNNQQLKKLPL